MRSRRTPAEWAELRETVSSLAGRLPCDQIAAKVGMKPKSLTVYASQWGISLRLGSSTRAGAQESSRQDWIEREVRVRELAGSMPADKVAKAVGVTRSALVNYCHRVGISLKVRRDGSVDPWKAKAEELAEMVVELFDLDPDGSGNAVRLADRFLKEKLER